VRFEVAGGLPPPDACHCTSCRKHSGHFFVSTDVPRAALTISGADRIGWFHSSEKVRRGFCATCGSSLFWDPIHKDWIGVAMGAFERPTDTKIKFHIFVADRAEHVGEPTDAGESERIEWVPLSELRRIVRDNEMLDGLSLTGIAYALAIGILDEPA
jgi:hypothetical protein